MHIKLGQTDEIGEILSESDLDALAYDKQWNQYRLRLKENDLTTNIDVIKDLVSRAKSAYMSLTICCTRIQLRQSLWFAAQTFQACSAPLGR